MSVSVYIPTPYRIHTFGKSEVEAEGGTVLEVVKDVGRRYPGLSERLLTPEGTLPDYLAVYLNDEDIESLQSDRTPVKDGDEVAVIPAMAGGSEPGLLAEAQLDRYARQIILPEVGVEGQRKLLNAKVCIIGAGGLGCPVAMYLAAAGIGRIGIVDGDRVERSNLHRQPIHADRDVGKPKTQSVVRFIEELTPDVRVVVHDVVLTSENALDILGGYDVIVNGSDNFPTRYLVNDASYFLGKPLVDASILRFEGHASVYVPGSGCYRCLYPQPPAPGTIPSCAEGGVMGALAGQMGTLQAMETLKLVLGVGETLRGKLLVYDALTSKTRLLRWKANPECPLCGHAPTITGLIDYEAFCGVGIPQRGQAAAGETDISAQQARRLLEEGLARFVDVREPHQYAAGSIPGALSIPFDDLEQELSSLPSDRPVVFYCEVGQKSSLAALLAESEGLDAKNIAGGLVVWKNLGLPWEKRT